MQIELLKNIAQSIAGDKAKSVIELLYGKKNVNEFLIAKKLNVTINQTRNILYKLADEGIVGFVRKKDSKKGGWYTYFWTLNYDKSLMKFEEVLVRNLENLRNQLHSKKTERFFVCPNGDLELNEENALSYEYTCPECGEILQVKDSNKEVLALEKEISKTENLIQEVRNELQEIQKKYGKALVRKIKAEEKRKRAERAVQKKKRLREMQKHKNIEKSRKQKRKIKNKRRSS